MGEGGFRRCNGGQQAHIRIKFAGTVIGHWIGLGQFVALALFGDHMQELRAIKVLDVFQRRDQRFEIVPVDRSDVVEAKFLEQRGWHHHAFGMLFEALGQLKQRRRVLEHVFTNRFGCRIKTPTHQLGQVAVECPHRRADRHVVVVQDHQQLAILDARVVECLKSHASRHGAIANHRNRMTRLALLAGGQSHAQSRRNAGR